ncbi:glycoside hydrolase family 3 C-terminal domain-containing protein [Kitasatospora sp. NA04385]|uniref:glycoside hydrolase family 3 C-terminal domain-containing protein n=1 Tax=Kitasatospora sp. NA04385 TaxID=2742135 RepID=UPI0015903D7B|nr:glycoside hydrolase family 3 C-terminal domain-containing protein [Kitasatospora sp. NA04385]QKW23817.1 glycoside hydrolase family 3 C-terminal domain-containing protein [Kitasatospora sp. NA04385]
MTQLSMPPQLAADAPRPGHRTDHRVLDLEQKARLVSGGDTFRSSGEPAVGMHPIVCSDGPVGVRGERWDETDTALLLPCATALAASWDEESVARMGALLAGEARRKNVHVVLAPTLNLHRSPLGGRNFECFSEDPLLTARIGAAYIAGVQSRGVAATAKHYVANDSETERLTVDARVDERTLREVYLAPFEAAVRAGVWAVMSAYNRVNGTSMVEHPLLAEPLKGEWGFDGLVVSDWGSVHEADGPGAAACDLAMPGPNPAWGPALAAAVRAGRVPAAALDDKVERLLRLAERVGAFDPPAPGGQAPVPTDPATRGALRAAAVAGTVLLHNPERLLPLEESALRRVAVIGPNAATARVQGGGSASVFPAAPLSPLAGLRAALDPAVEVVHAPGVHTNLRPTPLVAADCALPDGSAPGVLVRYLAADGSLVHAEARSTGRVLEPSAEVDLTPVRTIEVETRFTAPTAGRWRLGVVGLGALRLEADGEVLLEEYVEPLSDDPTYLHVSPSFRQVELELAERQEVALLARRTVESAHGRVLVLAADRPEAELEREFAHAVELAAAADVAVVVVGTTDEHESEGFDRAGLRLPGRQDELVAAVAAANPRTVVVVNTGSPVLLPWRERVGAVLTCWFPGQEGGAALAEVLLGRAEPGGRLPTTWPDAEADCPVYSTAPADGRLEYAEGPHLGHRGWLRAGRTPAYWFGHGLGWGEWSYLALGAPSDPAADGSRTVRVTLRNDGPRRSRETVQLYLSRPASELDRPVRWLAGFGAVEAGPGQRVHVDLVLPARALEHWSPEEHAWLTEPGTFVLQAGPNCGELPLAAALSVDA